MLHEKGVNALNGLSSFLQKMNDIAYAIYDYGVNALNGLSSFLPNNKRKLEDKKNGVNALNGLSSFLPYGTRAEYPLHAKRCQRPKRALFISTLSKPLANASS